MCGVPASNLYGRSFQVLPSNVTVPNHVAAAQERRHRLEHGLAAVEHADAGRAVDLVAGEARRSPRRAPARRPAMWYDRLRPVDQHGARRPRAPARRSRATGLIVPSAFDRCTTATIFVRGVSSRSNSSMTSSPRSSIGADRSVAPVRVAQQLPRHDVRVVLHRRDEHLVARAGRSASPHARATRLMLSVAFRVKTISRVGRGVEERAHRLARRLVGRRSRARSARGRRGARWRCRRS